VNTTFSINSSSVYVESVVVAENLTPDEEIYWIPVTYYDYENENNEKNKTIRVLDNKYTSDVVVNLTTLMSNTR